MKEHNKDIHTALKNHDSSFEDVFKLNHKAEEEGYATISFVREQLMQSYGEKLVRRAASAKSFYEIQTTLNNHDSSFEDI